MLKRTYRLDHSVKYHDAIYEQRNVWVVQDGEYIGYGRIVDFTDKAVTIVDAETQQVEHYLRANCQFFAEK